MGNCVFNNETPYSKTSSATQTTNDLFLEAAFRALVHWQKGCPPNRELRDYLQLLPRFEVHALRRVVLPNHSGSNGKNGARLCRGPISPMNWRPRSPAYSSRRPVAAHSKANCSKARVIGFSIRCSDSTLRMAASWFDLEPEGICWLEGQPSCRLHPYNRGSFLCCQAQGDDAVFDLGFQHFCGPAASTTASTISLTHAVQSVFCENRAE